MTRVNSFDLTPFYRNTVGIDRLLDSMMNRLDANNTGYPPYNVIRLSEDSYRIEVALAGFAEKEIDITVKDGFLMITAEKTDEAVTEYLYKGIGCRSFSKSFQLSDYVEVVGATFSNGILTVALERHMPEAMKPRKIAIESK